MVRVGGWEGGENGVSEGWSSVRGALAGPVEDAQAATGCYLSLSFPSFPPSLLPFLPPFLLVDPPECVVALIPLSPSLPL